MNYYSKSKYVMFCDCHKRLWCEKYHSEEKKEINNESVLANGNAVGALARTYFPNTYYVDSPDNDLNYMVKETKRLMDMGAETIAEASFFYMNNYCACDLLHKNEDGSYDIYEVKSTTKIVEHYYDDIAYQLYVLTNCGIKVRNTYLMYINSFYVFHGELDIHSYFKVVDLTVEAKTKQLEIEPQLQISDLILSSSIPPVVDISKLCEDCPFKEYCYKEKGLKDDSVLNLYFNRNKYKQLQQGILTFSDVLKSNCKLTDIQRRQIDFYYNDKEEYFDKEKVATFVNTIKYPIYFLDFESNQYAIPRFEGTKPYSQVCFQYSLHVLTADGDLSHYEFLGDERKDFRLDLVKQLICDLKDEGSIIAYNKSFEMTRIKDLVNLYPNYKTELEALLERFVDLADVFQKGYYYNKAMGKSFSIKSVLPALFPNDPSLDYHNLEGIHNGSEAMYEFENMINLELSKREIVRDNLLKYCYLDTYAMVKIYQLLKEKIA